jgi:hypothetical protein
MNVHAAIATFDFTIFGWRGEAGGYEGLYQDINIDIV